MNFDRYDAEALLTDALICIDQREPLDGMSGDYVHRVLEALLRRVIDRKLKGLAEDVLMIRRGARPAECGLRSEDPLATCLRVQREIRRGAAL